jgi:hypothetical protein
MPLALLDFQPASSELLEHRKLSQPGCVALSSLQVVGNTPDSAASSPASSKSFIVTRFFQAPPAGSQLDTIAPVIVGTHSPRFRGVQAQDMIQLFMDRLPLATIDGCAFKIIKHELL